MIFRVKAANLACWFPPWTVTREQWSSMSWPAVSGIAVDTLLFSRIGVLLLSGRQSFRNSWGFLWRLHATDACFSGRVGYGVVTSASSSMRSEYCSMDVMDIHSGHGRQDARCFFSTQSGGGRFVDGHGTGSPSSF